jgi:hypothetical protein
MERFPLAQVPGEFEKTVANVGIPQDLNIVHSRSKRILILWRT